MKHDFANGWMPMQANPPRVFEMLEVKLDDHSVCTALWTGAKWWCGARPVQPLAWRLQENEGG